MTAAPSNHAAMSLPRRLAWALRQSTARAATYAEKKRFAMDQSSSRRHPLLREGLLMLGDALSLEASLGRGSLKILRAPELTLAYFGNDYLKSESEVRSIFIPSGEASVEELGRMNVWEAQRRAGPLLGESGMAVFELSHLLPCSPGWARASLRCPAWVKWRVKIPNDPARLWQGLNEHRRRHLKAIQAGGYEYAYTTDRGEMEEFYGQVYAPYIIARHGALAMRATEELKQDICRKGGLLKVLCRGSMIGGGTGFLRGDTWFAM